MDPATLKQFDLFKDVDESKLNKIAPFTMLVSFPEGKTIIQEGGYSNDFYAIEEGTVRVERSGEKIAVLGYGSLGGEELGFGSDVFRSEPLPVVGLPPR